MEKQMINKTDVTKYRLLLDNILVKGAKIEEVDGVLNPDSYEDKPEIGEVISIGKQVKDINVGDTVMFNKYSITKFNFDGDDYFAIRLEDVIGYQR